MAGGKLTPRQKMINLMYLVFIAMMALNMSKEVLTAFGLMNEKLETSNTTALEQNKVIADDLAQKAADNSEQYGEPKKIADKVMASTNEFYNFIEGLKPTFTDGAKRLENGSYDYEVMDKTNKNDDWFVEGRYSQKGQEVVDNINKYRESLNSALGGQKKYEPILKKANALFSTGDVTDRQGIKKLYLDYHYKGYPAIASLTKLTALQNDAKVLESEIMNALIGNTALVAASMSNYTAIVVLDKNAFYQGEQVTGKVVLGRYDSTTVPTSVDVNGGKAEIKDGQAVLSLSAGSIGEHKLGGKFVFMEDGKPIEIPIDGQYVVVPKPNSANISADKMNVVYIGVDNPMTISFAGISDSDVTATAPGLTKSSSAGKYVWRPQGGSTEATVSVTGKLPGGETASDKKTFRVKTIPAPATSLRGIVGGSKGSKENLTNSPINVVFSDFDFEVKTTVIQFEVKAPGSSTIVCQGNRFNAAAIAAINKAPNGGNVIISNVKTRIEGTNVPIKDSTPFVWEIQ